MTEVVRERLDAPAVEVRERDVWLDNVKVLAILLVVVGHGVGTVRNQSELAPAVSNFIYIFHIPLFVIVSGWTARRVSASSANVMKTVLQLIVPYVIFESFTSWLRTATGFVHRWNSRPSGCRICCRWPPGGCGGHG